MIIYIFFKTYYESGHNGLIINYPLLGCNHRSLKWKNRQCNSCYAMLYRVTLDYVTSNMYT